MRFLESADYPAFVQHVSVAFAAAGGVIASSVLIGLSQTPARFCGAKFRGLAL